MVGYFWWLAASGRVWRHRPLYGRYCRGGGIRTSLQTRLDPRSDHHDAARGIYSGGGTRTVPRSLCRLARPVRDRAAAGGYEPPDPRLGSRIGALADPRGSPRGGAPISRLGVDGRPKRNQVPAVVRPVEKVVWRELFKYPRSVAAGLSDRPERDRNHRVRIVASYAFRHGPACQPGRGFGPGNLVEPRTDRRALFLLVALGCDWAPHSDRADLRDRWRDNVAGWVLERPAPRPLLGLLFDDHGAAILRQRWLFDHWTVDGRDLAVAVARQRHGTGLRRRQSRQVHRSGWARGDRGIVELRQPAGNRRRPDPGDELLRRLVCPGTRSGLVHRLRDARPDDRRDWQHPHRQEVGCGGDQGARGALTNDV